jgi:hypothetical protein
MPENSGQDPSLDYIAQEVRKYHDAFRQEFELLSSDNIPAIKEKVKERFSTKLLSFVETIIELSESSESESTRLNAAKFGLNFVLGDVVEDPKDDPLNKLINSLIKKEEKIKSNAQKEAAEQELTPREYDEILHEDEEQNYEN